MLRPPPLARGDVVRVIAPAGPVDGERLARGLAVLRDRFGLRPRLREDVVARAGYLAGPDPRRAAEWREAIEDDAASAILCARGGYGSMRILPTIDPRPLLARPRLVVGFSDVTAIHAHLNAAGLATVHGPGVAQLASLTEGALDHLHALLFGHAPPPGSEGPPAPGAGLVADETIRPGRAQGPLLGGNLTLLSHLAGTPHLPSFAGAILLLEDVGERPYRVDRCLTQLQLAGVLDGIAGVAVGRLTDCDGEEGGPSGLDVVRSWARERGVPAISGLPVGHVDENLAVPLGARVRLLAPGPGEGGPPRLLFDDGATG